MLLLVVDSFVLLIAATIALVIHRMFLTSSQLNVSSFSLHQQDVWLLVPILAWMIFAFINESYDIELSAHPARTIHSLLFTLVGVSIFYVVFFFLFSREILFIEIFGFGFHPPRFTPILFLISAFGLIYIWRMFYIRFLTGAMRKRRALVVGAGKAGCALVQAIHQSSQHYEIIGFIDDDPSKQHMAYKGIPVIGTRQDLAYHVGATRSREIIVAITHDIHTDLLRALMECYERGVPIKPLSMFYSEILGRFPVEHLGQRWISLPFWGDASMPTMYELLKRLSDILIALIGLSLLAIFSPIIALVIYVDNPGSIFYTQTRLGKSGKPFRIIKFRSMITNAEKVGSAVWASKDDPRITRVGKFLRRTRIDEAPQLLNVLRGDMSIVGPRPERPEFISQLEQQIPFYRARLRVKPGITGWAQIKYRYGNSIEDTLIKLEYDLYYIKQRSFLLDVLIMLRTARIMLEFKGT
jgi:exopolysaccharide biosynthesis polyprenyl glycosylphosphotransferase